MTNSGTSFNFTMFFDGACPLCSREVNMLRRRDKKSRIRFIDTAAKSFNPRDYGISSDPNRLIHGMMSDGSIVVGVEVFRQVYKEIGLGWLLAPTAWPILKPLFDAAYLVFAKYRIPLGRLFGRHCDDGSCDISGKK
jgi:predicted DCC family thiol-disulfide oxidoreductase YuxK